MDTCRICFKNTGTMDIFDNAQGISISSKIMYCCANIRIYRKDGVPAQVCSICEKELSLAYQFVLKCEAADKKLHSLNPEFGKLNDGYIKSEMKVEEDDQIELKDSFTDQQYNNIKVEIEQYDNCITQNPVITVAKIKTTNKKKVSKVSGQKCKQCGRHCNSRSTLIIHMRTHSDERPYACQSCDKKYKDSGGLKRHIERNHNKDRKRDVICESCGKGFYSKSEIKTHMRVHTGETPYACCFCPSKFTQIGALLRHKLRHTGEKAHSCTKCKKRFATKVELKGHLVSHTNEKKFICVICNVHFKYANNLRKHVKQHSSTSNFTCDYCKRTFKTKGNLKVHINNIHTGKSGTCNVCSKHVPNIEIHMWRHTGKRPHKCDMCSSSFCEKKSLTRHVNFRHIYNEKFKCIVNGCTCAFPSQPMLEYHVAKFHGSCVPYPCDACSKGFYRICDLSRHKLRYHKEIIAT